ncbi:MAG TPA: translation initiation factor IF-2 [Opitutaceae bacterium]|nr:translation initiation factor IF-2 [Opitutaceae bacterium]
MSIRIHELAKKIGMDNKQLLSLLKERKYDVKSVSSTIDNISAEAIAQEFASQSKNTATAVEPEPAEVSDGAASSATTPPVAPAATDEPQSFTTKLPSGAMVKSAQDIAREKEEAAKAAKPAPAVVIPSRPAAPAAPVSRPSAPPPPPPIRTAVVSAPPTPPPVSTPRPTPTPAPVSAPRPVSAPPAAPAVARPATAASAPAPVNIPGAPKAPSVPPAVSAPPIPTGSAPKPPPPIVSAPSTPPAIPSTATTPPMVTVQGDVKIIHLKPPIVVRDFATALGLKPFKLISELMEMGIFASMNQNIEESVAIKVGEKHGFLLEIKHRGDAAAQQAAKDKDKEAKKKIEDDESQHLVTRPPIVVILGHVDHGKTSLLDAIRKANVAAGEAGGITQHIGAYQIERNGRKITFLDTPGHAAFNKMRARGANVTDIAVLVVAADDGFMPQTDEALKHAQNAKVALIVAVNKMDVKGANIDQVKAQMQQRNIAPEDWGGETITVPVSAIKGTGVDDLLEMILLQADVLELKANPKAEASGVIIESQVDVGRGPLATVIVQRGTLKVGDAIVCGTQWAKVRAMFDDQGRTLKEATPATPARVIGWSGTPDSGATFKVVKNAREAENLADEAADAARKQTSTTDATPKEVSVESLFANIAATQNKVLKVIIKTDVFGSGEAVRNVLENIKSNKVSLEIVSIDVGLVTKNDVLMASAAGSVIIGFNTKLENGVTPLAKHHNVRIETFDIIYELADKVRDMMADLLEPELRESKIGGAEVRATFPLAKGFVAGCLVTEGKVSRNASARLRRGREIVYEGKVGTLKRFKDDANEVRAGLECGIKLDDFNGYQVGDLIECYEIQKVRASL